MLVQESVPISSRFKRAWNAFFIRDRDPTYEWRPSMGPSSGSNPGRHRLRLGNERSIIASIYMRIAVDVASVKFQHARLDSNGAFIGEKRGYLNDCLSLEANIDQTSEAFFLDAVLSMFDEGVVALVPIDTLGDPGAGEPFDVLSLRTGRITDWFPKDVRVNVYNENTGLREDITLPKAFTPIIENPFYTVMNEPNSTHRRLIEKLNLLDAIDKQSGSGKLDLIIQLPYAIKTEGRRELAESRRKALEDQLLGSKYGVAYSDITEKVTQLNRPVENNLMKQIEFLTSMLYSQLGITQSIFDGTASDEELTNYYSRTVDPIVRAFANEFIRKFLTKTARSQGQTIYYFKDPFKFIPVLKLAELADKLTRNEILSSNEFRGIIGYKPSSDPRADKLENKNLSQPRQNSNNKQMTEETQDGDDQNET